MGMREDGQQMRAARNRVGLTQKEVALQLGYTWRYYKRLESGHRRITEDIACRFVAIIEQRKVEQATLALRWQRIAA